MPKHVIRLLLLIGAFVVVAIVVRSYLIPDSFYVFGPYRADSVREIAADTPKFKGPDYCQACHEERHVEWSAGVHKTVKCEVCHGAAGDHPANGKLPVPTETVKLCTLCHEAMPARPAAQPQIVVAEHAGTTQCITCHNPHFPRIGGSATGETGAGPVAAETLLSQCTGCHGLKGLGVADFPPLAGKAADYLVTQMQAYRSGVRQHEMMNAIAESLSDRDIADLAAYFASPKGATGD
jgi:hypothetical protein